METELISQLGKFGFTQNFLTFVTGCIIFSPVCFINNPLHIIIMGVTMHYSQYIYLTYFVYKKREENFEQEDKKLFGIKYYKYFFTIALYGTIMAVISLFGRFDDTTLKHLIIIPLIGQMLHFYLDSQLWKFSEEHNRANVLNYIKQM